MFSVIIKNLNTVFANLLHFSKLDSRRTLSFMESGSFIDWSKSIGVEKLPSFKKNIIFFMKHPRMIRTVIMTLERIWFLVITTIAWDTRAFSAASSNVARIVCFSIIEKYCIVHSFLFVIISWTIFTISVYMIIEHLFQYFHLLLHLL